MLLLAGKENMGQEEEQAAGKRKMCGVMIEKKEGKLKQGDNEGGRERKQEMTEMKKSDKEKQKGKQKIK